MSGIGAKSADVISGNAGPRLRNGNMSKAAVSKQANGIELPDVIVSRMAESKSEKEASEILVSYSDYESIVDLFERNFSKDIIDAIIKVSNSVGMNEQEFMLQLFNDFYVRYKYLLDNVTPIKKKKKKYRNKSELKDSDKKGDAEVNRDRVVTGLFFSLDAAKFIEDNTNKVGIEKSVFIEDLIMNPTADPALMPKRLGSGDRKRVNIRLSRDVLSLAAKQAAQCGMRKGAWIGRLVEAHSIQNAWSPLSVSRFSEVREGRVAS